LVQERRLGGHEGGGHPQAQGLGHVVPAADRDHHPQLGLEVEGLQAGGAVVQVVPDLHPALLGQLAVEEAIELLDRLSAVLTHCRIPPPLPKRPALH